CARSDPSTCATSGCSCSATWSPPPAPGCSRSARTGWCCASPTRPCRSASPWPSSSPPCSPSGPGPGWPPTGSTNAACRWSPPPARAVPAPVLGVLPATGAVRLWMVYALALLLGCATAFDMPARQSFVSEMVGPDRVANAVGLNSASFNTARVIGPAAAGLLIAVVGIAPAFFLNAVSYLALIGGLLAMDSERLWRRPVVARGKGQIREGVRYVWATPVLRSTIVLVAVVVMLGLNYRVAVPLLARFAFDGGPRAHGDR